MTETAIKDINRFCWRRMWQFGGLYRRAIVAQIIIYTVIEALMTIVTSVFPYDSTIYLACLRTDPNNLTGLERLVTVQIGQSGKRADLPELLRIDNPFLPW